MIPFPEAQGGEHVEHNLKTNTLAISLFFGSPWMQQINRVFQQEVLQKLKFDARLYPFIEEFYLQIKLFGYTIFRKRGSGVEVLSGTDFVLRRDPKTYKIEPVFKTVLAGTSGWHLLIAKMPRFSRSGSQVHSTGAGIAAMAAALEIKKINDNAIERDTINSRPTIYTRVSSQLKSSGQQARPWFHAMHSHMVPSSVTGTMDFNTLIRSRGETLERLDDLTSTYRATEAANTQNKSHKELVVSDGRDMNEARHLHHEPAWMNWRIAQLQNTIAEVWEVPPAALGLNVNSERQAGASRLSEVVLLRWERHLRKMAALCVAAGKLLKEKIEIEACLSHYDLHQIERIVEPEYVRDLYSCVFGVEKDKISVDLIRQMQTSDIKGKSGNKTSEEKTELRTQRANGQ